MDIDYHYFVIKTLAHAAGFPEEDAQTIAYYSQQVDDFTKCIPMWVRQEPPAFFIENQYAKKMENGLWKVQPHPTGIDVLQSLESIIGIPPWHHFTLFRQSRWRIWKQRQTLQGRFIGVCEQMMTGRR